MEMGSGTVLWKGRPGTAPLLRDIKEGLIDKANNLGHKERTLPDGEGVKHSRHRQEHGQAYRDVSENGML